MQNVNSDTSESYSVSSQTSNVKFFAKYFREQNICRLLHILAQFLFTTSEMELNYYHQKVNVGVSLLVAERHMII